MQFVVFYSWQSDLPNNTNRGFIGSVIEKVAKDVRKSEDFSLIPIIDRDTKDVPGAPNISQAILEKIKICDAFVADVSIVTGDKSQGQRPSPNPNVLLELGYAIALLGWDKIVLICNEEYGADDDLPFDIRQNRRIRYRLLPESTKQEQRRSLAKQFQARLVELLRNGKSNRGDREPLLVISWNFWNFQDDTDPGEGVDSDILELKQMEDFSGLNVEVQKEIAVAKTIDGSIDPKWDEKLELYIGNARKFIDDLDDKTKIQDYSIRASVARVLPVTLSVVNDGNAAATDIRVRIPVPDWLLAFEEIPAKTETLKKPRIPKPSPPKIVDPLASFRQLGEWNSGVGHPSLIDFNVNRESDCYLKDGIMCFWADRLVHKHALTNTRDRFYLLAKRDAPIGDNLLKGKIFCSEYDDWCECELIVRVV